MYSVWTVEILPKSLKQLEKLDKPVKARILKWLEDRLESGATNPYLWGKQLDGNKLGHLWCYRIGNYRVICFIDEEIVKVAVVTIGHRRDVYD